MLWVKTVALGGDQVASLVVVHVGEVWATAAATTWVEQLVKEGDQRAILLDWGQHSAGRCRRRAWLVRSQAAKYASLRLVPAYYRGDVGRQWSLSTCCCGLGVVGAPAEHLDQFLTEGRGAVVTIDISAAAGSDLVRFLI